MHICRVTLCIKYSFLHVCFQTAPTAKAQWPGPGFCLDIPTLVCDPLAQLCEEGSDCETGICCSAYDCPPGVGVCRPLTPGMS